MSMMLIDQTKDSACKTAEADAIRAKTGGSAQIAYDWENNKGFADAIDAIPTGGATGGITQDQDGYLVVSDQAGGGGGGKGISDKNLLKNATFSAGYLNGSGVLQAAGSTTKEVITDEIDVSENIGAKIRICTANSDGTFWAALGYYDQNHDWISRTAGVTGFSGDLTMPSNAYYIRFMARTYGNAEFVVCFAADWIDAFDGYDPVKVTA